MNRSGIQAVRTLATAVAVLLHAELAFAHSGGTNADGTLGLGQGHVELTHTCVESGTWMGRLTLYQCVGTLRVVLA